MYKGHYVKYPFENGLAGLPNEYNFECLYYFVQNLVNKEKGEVNPPTNLKERCYYTFGKEIAEKYLVLYSEKMWNFSTEKIRLKRLERTTNPFVENTIKSSCVRHAIDFVRRSDKDE
ncbi:MAG: hypothetical protein WAV32_06460 [Halobacteriota archaeon]